MLPCVQIAVDRAAPQDEVSGHHSYLGGVGQGSGPPTGAGGPLRGGAGALPGAYGALPGGLDFGGGVRTWLTSSSCLQN